MKRTFARAALVGAALVASAAVAPPCLADPVWITGAWIRALPDDLPAGGYFTLHNGTGRPLTLIGAGSPACGMLMLHRTQDMSGMSSMSDVPSITVPQERTFEFAPGGYHLMCMGPTAMLHPGAVVPVTLNFADGARLTAPFQVRNAAGR
ncbi:MAG: copper chaperone PCu(A)C [Rhizomicrobium sp.]